MVESISGLVMLSLLNSPFCVYQMMKSEPSQQMHYRTYRVSRDNWKNYGAAMPQLT